jgi:hypothetical protein
MGFSISWAAVHGISQAETFSRLGLGDTGEDDEFFESPFAGATSADGWTLIVSSNCDYFRQKDRLAALSNGARVVAGCAEEHVMFSSSEEWSGGARLWLVEHEGESGDVTDLTTQGNPPSSLPAVRDAMMKTQGDQTDVDYGFEIPLLLAKEIVGFKHDEENARYSFRRLHPLGETTAKKGGLFGWLGKFG